MDMNFLDPNLAFPDQVTRVLPEDAAGQSAEKSGSQHDMTNASDRYYGFTTKINCCSPSCSANMKTGFNPQHGVTRACKQKQIFIQNVT